MKVLHLPFTFYPDAAGGTEVYVASLARGLMRRGVDVGVAAPGQSDDNYSHEGLHIRRYAIGDPADLESVYGGDDPVVGQALARVLDQEQPNIVHLHAFTRGVSLAAVREAHQRGLPCVFTYHTPTISCQRGTLLRWGRDVCDGYLDLTRCTACVLQGHGLPTSVAKGVGRFPTAAGSALGWVGLQGGPWTALRMRQLVAVRHAAFRDLMREVDRVVVVSEWARALLDRNGVPVDKIVLSRHGLNMPPPTGDPFVHAGRTDQSRPLRVLYLGRMTPAKGIHALIEAFRHLPSTPLELHIYGVEQGSADREYADRLRSIARGDPRIHFHEPVNSDETVELIGRHDVLAVPSQLLETGPLVVLEAFAAQVPMMGSDLGGIRELVRNQVDGVLVEPASVDAWAETLKQVTDQPEILERLRHGIRPPRTVNEVVDDMLDVYHGVLENTGAGRTALHAGDAWSAPYQSPPRRA